MKSITSPVGPVQETTPIRFNAPLPEKVDVVIIGGGVIGIFTALYAARAGLKIALLEKGRIAGEQSSRNWGWIRKHGRDPAELPIMMEAIDLWEAADRDVKGKTGFVRNGVCYLASSQKKLAMREVWVEETAKPHQLQTKMLSASEITSLIERTGTGDNAHKWIGASFTPDDARAEPWQAVPAIADLAQAEGVTIIENCAARKLEISAGSITGIHTENGFIGCEQIVLCAGAWSSLFAKAHGINIPQLSVRSTVCQTAPLPDFFSGNAADENLSFRRRQDGGYTLAGGSRHDLYIGPDAFRHFFKYLPVAAEHISDTAFSPFPPRNFPDFWGMKRKWESDDVTPFETMRVLNPPPKKSQINKIRSNFAARFPQIGKPEIKLSWAGMIDAMPDIIPIVDRTSTLPDLIIATGMSGHGFGIGPGFGRILADMLQEKPAGYDMQRFRFNRFTDGSKIRPGPAI